MCQEWVFRMRILTEYYFWNALFSLRDPKTTMGRGMVVVSFIFIILCLNNEEYYLSLLLPLFIGLKVAGYSFSGSIPPKFEHKLRCHKQRFGKIATTVLLDKDENLLRSGLQ